MITADGVRTMASQSPAVNQFPYYYKNGSLDSFEGFFWLQMGPITAPPHKVGEALLTKDRDDMYGTGRQAWQYLTGQRRVRRAPSIAYDTPNFVLSGFANFDEAWIFNGSLDRYEWKFVEKKEIYIPYNCNRFYQGTVDQILTSNGPNPDWVRWELHRVWVVEANLAPGKRNLIDRRVIYIDEDTWRGIMRDG